MMFRRLMHRPFSVATPQSCESPAPDPDALPEGTTPPNSRVRSPPGAVHVSSETGIAEVRIRAFRVGFVGALGVIAALLLYGVLQHLDTLILYVAIAVFLALGLDPIVSWIERRRIPRFTAIVIVLLVTFGLVAGLVAAAIPIITEQVSRVTENWPNVVSTVRSYPIVQGLSKAIGTDVISTSLDWLGSWLKTAFNVDTFVKVGAGIAGGLTGTILVFILMLYFLASLRGMKRYSLQFVPATSRRTVQSILEDITGAVGRYVIGQLSLGAINGVLSLIFLSILQVQASILLAFLALLGSIIPLVGTLSAAVVISLVCLLSSPWTALAAAIYYLVYMQVEAYIISPRIMSKAVAVPGALVVIAAVAGATLGNVPGAIVAIPVAASLVIIIEKVWFPRQNKL